MQLQLYATPVRKHLRRWLHCLCVAYSKLLELMDWSHQIQVVYENWQFSMNIWSITAARCTVHYSLQHLSRRLSAQQTRSSEARWALPPSVDLVYNTNRWRHNTLKTNCPKSTIFTPPPYGDPQRYRQQVEKRPGQSSTTMQIFTTIGLRFLSIGKKYNLGLLSYAIDF